MLWRAYRNLHLHDLDPLVELAELNRFEKLHELNRVFDEAWKAVSLDDYEAGGLAAAERRGPEDSKPRRPLRVRLVRGALLSLRGAMFSASACDTYLWLRTKYISLVFAVLRTSCEEGKDGCSQSTHLVTIDV